MVKKTITTQAKQMVEAPLDLIEMVLIKHQEAILEVCREQQDEIEKLRHKLDELLAALNIVKACDAGLYESAIAKCKEATHD